MKEQRLTVNTKKDSDLRFHYGASHTEVKSKSSLRWEKQQNELVPEKKWDLPELYEDAAQC